MGKFHSNGKDRAKLDEWFRSRAIDQLKKLSYNDGHMRLLPTSVLRFAPTLRLAMQDTVDLHIHVYAWMV